MSKAGEILDKAKKTASSKKELKATLSQAGDKLKSIAENSRDIQELKGKLEVLMKMLQTHVSGEYRAFPTSTLILVVFALAYFITPTDFIPDFIPAIGFTDDATVIMLVMRKVSGDIDKFSDWLDDNTNSVEEVE